MSSMVGNVAVAIATRRQELIGKPLSRVYEELARAAIKAMREPADVVLEQGPPDPYMDAQVWARMIDAALSEPSP